MVDHYSRTPDGLLRALGEVCPVSMFSAAESESRVRHGPLRINETELSVKGELGVYLGGGAREGVGGDGGEWRLGMCGRG